MVLSIALDLLTLRVERHDLLNKVSFGVIGASDQITVASGSSCGLVFTAVHAWAHVRVYWHGDSFLTHEICALSPEAHRHLLSGGVWVVRLFDLLRLVLFLLLVGVEELLCGLLLLGLSVGVGWLSLGFGLGGRGLLGSLLLGLDYDRHMQRLD